MRPSRSLERVSHEHRNGHGSHAARHGRNERNPRVCRFEIDVPVRRYPFFAAASETRFIPTSMTTAPSPIMSPLIACALPMAAMSISASLVSDPRSLVTEWQMVTVALPLACFRARSIATGFPTRMLLPTTTTRLPCARTPERSSSSRMPSGVQGMKRGLSTRDARYCRDAIHRRPWRERCSR